MTNVEATVNAKACLNVDENSTNGEEKRFTTAIAAEQVTVFSCEKSEVLRVKDDPNNPLPFNIYIRNYSHEEAAVIAYGILSHLRHSGVSDPETENAFDEVLSFLSIRSVKGQIPF